MSITDLPCLVINLEERKDRWQNMMKGLKDFKNVQRFDAINVKDFVLDDLPISLNAKYIINNNT
jgi:GR25 family glycosyltransferase involved in LPS biosynthesis